MSKNGKAGPIAVAETSTGFAITYPTTESRRSFNLPKPSPDQPRPPFGESFAIPPEDYATLMTTIEAHLRNQR